MLIVVRKKEGEAYSLRLSGKLGIVFLHRGPFSNTVPRRCRVMKCGPPAAELQAEVGGTYHFSWPKQDWHLRGKFTMFDRGKTLGFTWKWDHESIDVTRVTLLFHSMPNGGTKLTLLHEGYAKNSEAKKTRDEHIEGWTFFLRNLQEQGQES